jgi:hypothetical protein
MRSIFFEAAAGFARNVVRRSSGKLQIGRPSSHSPTGFRKSTVWYAAVATVASCCAAMILSGCGSISGGAEVTATGSLVASANTLSFGIVTVGQTSSATVTLKNNTTDSVQISSLSVTGPFSVPAQSNMPVTVAGGGTYTVSIRFSPTAAGAATGTLALTSNSTSGNPTVSLSGTGAAPAANAPGAMVSPSPGSVLSSSSQTFTWSAGSGVTGYQLWVGTTGVGSQNVGTYSKGAATGNTVSTSVTGLPTEGATLYVRLLSEIQGNWQSADYTYTEASAAAAQTASLSGMSCASAAITGAGTVNCTVTLNAAAAAGGDSVDLSSNDSSLTVPSSVTVAANATSATFTAVAQAVSAKQNATILATLDSSSADYELELDPQPASGGTAALSLGANSLSFGDVTVNSQSTPQFLTLTSSGTAPLTINSATVTGAGFTIAGQSFPVTLNPGNGVTLQVKFAPTATGEVTGAITIATNAPANGTATVALSGNGAATTGVLSTLFCQSATIMGAGSDACTVTLTAAAPVNGVTLNLSSSNSALTVPATVTIPSGSSSGFFTATATAVTSNQTANVVAKAGPYSKVFAVQLEADAPALSVSATDLTFGDVNLNAPATQSVTLTSSGTSPLTINSAAVTGAGFTISGAAFPVTLNPGRSVSVQVQFDPTTAGQATGEITVVSNAATNGTVVISLSGTGQSAAGALSGLTCANATITGAATDSCTVSLNGAAPTGGLAVALSSSNSAVTVPASVTVASGARTATFTATAVAVTSTQTATLTAAANGNSKVYSLRLSAQTAALSLSTNNLSFGDVDLNTPTSQSVTLTSSGTSALTISAAALSGSGFTMGGATFPLTLNPGQTATLQVTFDPTAAGAMTGTIVITSNATTNPTTTISLSGTGDATTGALSGVSCATMSYTDAGTDACMVTLSAAAPAGGLAVALASNNSAVTVPASVTVSAGATSAPFTATVAAVTSSQTATLTATASGVAKTLVLQLSGGAPGLTLGSTTIAFGDVGLNTPATQTLTLTSSGGAPLTISTGTLTGTGFTMSGVTFPVTLNPGQAATLDLQFDPTAVGAETGLVTITTNDPTQGTVTIALSGTGISTPTYEVQLTWDAPTSTTDPAVGYNVYRSTASGAYQLLNTSINSPTTFTDTTVVSGDSYNYEVTSVDASGVESAPSNVYAAAIP